MSILHEVHAVLGDIMTRGRVESLSQLGSEHETLRVDLDAIEEVARLLKGIGFDMLVDICGVDYPTREARFEVVYQLLSMTHNARLTLKVHAAEGVDVPSLCPVFKAACWFEREAFDMFGIKFCGNPDLRRILTDYGFSHFPLRKDFPLTGFDELSFNTSSGEVEYSPVRLPQEFRDFNFESPWAGVQEDIRNAGDNCGTD